MPEKTKQQIRSYPNCSIQDCVTKCSGVKISSDIFLSNPLARASHLRTCALLSLSALVFLGVGERALVISSWLFSLLRFAQFSFQNVQPNEQLQSSQIFKYSWIIRSKTREKVSSKNLISLSYYYLVLSLKLFPT